MGREKPMDAEACKPLVMSPAYCATHHGCHWLECVAVLAARLAMAENAAENWKRDALRVADAADKYATRLRSLEGALRDLLDNSPVNCQCAACRNARVALTPAPKCIACSDSEWRPRYMHTCVVRNDTRTIPERNQT